MPDLVMATETICTTFNEAWQDRTAIEWPNLVAESKLNEGDDPYCALDILLEDGGQVAISGSIFNRSGTVVVRIFTLAGKRGLEEAHLLAKVASDAFEGKSIDGVSFKNVHARTVGRDGAWFQVNVRAEFEFDELKQ